MHSSVFGVIYRSELSFWCKILLSMIVNNSRIVLQAEHSGTYAIMQCRLCSGRPWLDAQAFTFGWVAPLVGGRLDLFRQNWFRSFQAQSVNVFKDMDQFKIWGTSHVKTSLVFTQLCFVLNALDLSLAHPDVNNYAGIGEFHPNHPAELSTSSLSGW